MSASLEYIVYRLAFKMNMSRDEMYSLDFIEFLDLMLVDVREEELEYVEKQISMIMSMNSVIELIYTGSSSYIDELVSYIQEVEEGGEFGETGDDVLSIEELEELEEIFEGV